MYNIKSVKKLKLFHPKVNKFYGFPKVNVISIEESEERRSILKTKFEKYGIDYKFHIFPRYYNGLYNFTNDDYTEEDLNLWSNGPTTSHLLAIREWLNTTNEPYGFFAEDDVDFSTSEYWNFEWKDFFKKFPSDWSLVQLSLVREHPHGIFYFYPDKKLKLRHRCWCDWNLAAYMITRRHAEEVIYHYMDGDNFRLKYCGRDRHDRKDDPQRWWAVNAIAENLIFSLFGENYVAPVFLESMQYSTSFFDTTTDDLKRKHSDNRTQSREDVLEWWKENGPTLDLDEFFSLS